MTGQIFVKCRVPNKNLTIGKWLTLMKAGALIEKNRDHCSFLSLGSTIIFEGWRYWAIGNFNGTKDYSVVLTYGVMLWIWTRSRYGAATNIYHGAKDDFEWRFERGRKEFLTNGKWSYQRTGRFTSSSAVFPYILTVPLRDQSIFIGIRDREMGSSQC